jgi:hypothetical protein
MSSRDRYMALMAGVLQIANDLLRCPSRTALGQVQTSSPRAKREGCPLTMVSPQIEYSRTRRKSRVQRRRRQLG